MKKQLEQLIPLLFRFLDRFFYKKEYIVFSARSAKAYADNSKVLFEGLLPKYPHQAFYYTKKKSVLATIPKNGVYAYSFKGLWVLLKSRLLVFTHGKSDFFPYCPGTHPQRLFLNLFHAIAVKKVGQNGSKSLSQEIDKWDYFLVSSDFEKAFIKKQYDFDDNQLLTYGQPRNDIIVQNAKQAPIKSSKLVLYAPTFRDHNLTQLFPFEDIDLLALDTFLGKHNMEIMIRLHVQEEQKYAKNKVFMQLKNIYFKGSDKIPSVNDYLHNVDVLLSDYSSIALDYLLLDRPIAYMPYDYEEYERIRGFSFDYFEHLAGPVIKTQSDLQTFLLAETDNFTEKRKALKDLFHKHQDGKSTERLIQFIQTHE